MRHVNQPVRKKDAMALVTGKPVYTGDLRDRALLPGDRFHLVVSNPPYFRAGSGKSGGQARMDHTCSVAELCALYMSAIGLPTDSLERPMRAILAVEPDYDRARLQLLQLLVSRDSMQAAVDLCHEGRLYSPTQLVYYYYEGLCLYRLDRPADALRVLEGGTARIDASADSELASDLYATLGDLYYEDGRHEQAYAAYDSALVYNPDNYLCMNNYAYFLSLRGERLDRAEELARKAVGSAPDDPTFLDTYAWVLFVKGQYTQARIYIDQTLRHAGDEPDDMDDPDL